MKTLDGIDFDGLRLVDNLFFLFVYEYEFLFIIRELTHLLLLINTKRTEAN